MNEQNMYHPETITALNQLAELEYFWIESRMLPHNRIIPKSILSSRLDTIDLDQLKGFAKVFGQIIDFRSRFTATHSSGVAAVAMELTEISGFSETECKLMEVAGFLHDLGKLAIPNEVLEKNGKLDCKELNIMRKHTYYTYDILSKIKGLEQVTVWAAFHHEKLTGYGYPFHITGNALTRFSRIMVVADIFTALTEDRPYREGMDVGKAMRILADMAETDEIDKKIVALVEDNLQRIDKVRIVAQENALREYKNLH
jgi:HD-GYP domain-containing protein (c-di-GMP phosphodiesterase class II)